MNFLVNIFLNFFNFLYNDIFLPVAFSIIKCGPIPRHVAIIMDGNRRWAQTHQMEKQKGHIFGYKKLEQSLKWFDQIGIKEVTVFAFSIENYKRPKPEIDALMTLAIEKFDEMMKKSSVIDKYKLRVRILGNVSLLPSNVLESARRVENYSKNNERVTLNFCFSYTSTDEITRCIYKAVKNGFSSMAQEEGGNYNVTPELLSKNMYCETEPEVVIRTSGEKRLSDFLTWQSSCTSSLSFLDIFWPDFSIWNLCSTILEYQKNYHRIEKYKKYIREIESQDLQQIK